MNNINDFTMEDISEILQKLEKYKEEHIEGQISNMLYRAEKVNHTIRCDEKSPESLRMSKIRQQLIVLKNNYESLSTNIPNEDKINIMTTVASVHTQLERLEKKTGEDNGS